MKRRTLSIVLSLLMVLTFLPFLPGAAEEAYAEGEIPEVTVTIEPGIIGGTPITYKNTDPGRMRTPEVYTNGMFDWDGSSLWYRYPDLPESFSKPGYTFIGWTSTVYDELKTSFTCLVSEDFIVTAHWGRAVILDPGDGTGTSQEAVSSEDGRFVVPDCPVSFEPPSEGKVLARWKSVKPDGSTEWYYPGETIQFDMSGSYTPLTLTAVWGDPLLTLCSYDFSDGTSGQGGWFKVYAAEAAVEPDWSPGCNNYTATMGAEYTVVAIPDNGKRFDGWYLGKYIGKDAQGNPTQDAVPYLGKNGYPDGHYQVSDMWTRAYTFTVTGNTVLCPVFEDAPLVNFVDIGNVWTKLDYVNPPAFTLETNPNEEGLSDFIEIAGEKWEAEDGQTVEMHYETDEESGERVQVVDGAFVKDKTYKYTAYVRAKGDNDFDSYYGFRFVYGGKDYDLDDLEVEYLENDKLVAISGFVPDTTVKGVSIKDGNVTGIKTKTYTGKAQTQTVIVTLDDKTLQKGTDYTVSYKNNIRAGTATMTITGIGDYEGSITKTFKINKAKNPMTVKAKTATVRYSRLKKANQTLTVSKVLTISKKQGTATYVKKSGSSKITISKKTGKVTVKKGLKKGTYRVKVAVTASGTTNYNKVTKTVTFTVKVR